MIGVNCIHCWPNSIFSRRYGFICTRTCRILMQSTLVDTRRQHCCHIGVLNKFMQTHRERRWEKTRVFPQHQHGLIWFCAIAIDFFDKTIFLPNDLFVCLFVWLLIFVVKCGIKSVEMHAIGTVGSVSGGDRFIYWIALWALLYAVRQQKEEKPFLCNC